MPPATVEVAHATLEGCHAPHVTRFPVGVTPASALTHTGAAAPGRRALERAPSRRQSYEILERFDEEGESAKTTNRSQLQNLLTYCRLNKGRVHFVVVFDLTRFARDKTTTSRSALTCSRWAST
jgi:hypothetical protein